MSLTDQVWREDIVDQQDTVRDSAKVLNDYAKRMRYQGAPAELVRKVEKLRDQAASMNDDLEELKQYFPEQPD